MGKRLGIQTIEFCNYPSIIGNYTIVGNKEGNSNFKDIDELNEVIIRVTAENGSTRDYVLNTYKRHDAYFSNRLLRLTINYGTLTPDFNPDVNNYAVTVPNSVSSVSVYAVPNSNAKVTGTGKKELQEGANKVDVIVTAQDGKTTKTYTINITRQTVEESETEVEENTVDENTVIEEPVVEVVGLTDLKVEGYTLSPAFDNKVYEYKLDINKNISELKINPITSGENIKVDVVGNTELQEGENVITLLVNNSDKDETTTYQIIVNKTSQVDLTDWNSSIENANKEMQKRDMIIVITIGFIVVASIVFIVYKRRYNKKENTTNSKIDKVDEEERIDLNEDKELFNRVVDKMYMQVANGVSTYYMEVNNSRHDIVEYLDEKGLKPTSESNNKPSKKNNNENNTTNNTTRNDKTTSENNTTSNETENNN